MFPGHNSAIADILNHTKGLDSEQVESAIQEQVRTGNPLAQTVLDLELLTRDELLAAVASYLHFPYIPAPRESFEEGLSSQVSGKIAHRYGIFPYRSKNSELQLLVVDPFNHAIVQDLSFALNRDITLVVSDPEIVMQLICSVYGTESTSVEEVMEELNEIARTGGMAGEIDLENAIEEAPVIRFVNLVLEQAIKGKASDIHFEPFEDLFRIRYRVDGSLYEMSPTPVNLALPVISRIKVLSNLNIAEQRVPQDGRIRMTLAARPVDLRVSTLPTQFGESVVLRVLDKSVAGLELGGLGMPQSVYRDTREIIKRPNGVFIVTGPTGSGKTTTLYSCLKILNRDGHKILTAEDPVEYEIDGIIQLAVNPGIGLSFAHALRSFLRQDPDILMVGEIRDLETAKIAFQAAQTGHLVLTTLHTNDAPGAITRLIDMGMEPYLIASSLEAVLAQRLVRVLCHVCKTPFVPDDAILQNIFREEPEFPPTIFQAKGCGECHQTGYRGRKGLFELMMINDTVRKLMVDQASASQIKKHALAAGMTTLRQSGMEAMAAGMTTIEEVLNGT